MRVTRAALVWVFGVAATFLGVGPLGGTASSLDDEHVHAASTIWAGPSTSPVRETKAPAPKIGVDVGDIDARPTDSLSWTAPAQTAADPGEHAARAPPATPRV